MIPIILIACQFIEPKYVGCQGAIMWCNEDKSACMISYLSCNVSNTGNIWLPKKCYKIK